MNGNIEARLERSLRNQVRAPKLDGRFDAAVWARIEAETAKAVAPPAPVKSSRWLLVSNVVGVAATVVLVAVFGSQSLGGLELGVSMPEIQPGLVEKLTQNLAWPITIVALGFGLMFTNAGRRLRAEYFS